MKKEKGIQTSKNHHVHVSSFTDVWSAMRVDPAIIMVFIQDRWENFDESITPANEGAW